MYYVFCYSFSSTARFYTLSLHDALPIYRRLAFSRLRDDAAVGKLFAELGPRYKERPGGYLRILKFGHRAGDNAPMAYVELVDRPQDDDAADEAASES